MQTELGLVPIERTDPTAQRLAVVGRLAYSRLSRRYVKFNLLTEINLARDPQNGRPKINADFLLVVVVRKSGRK